MNPLRKKFRCKNVSADKKKKPATLPEKEPRFKNIPCTLMISSSPFGEVFIRGIHPFPNLAHKHTKNESCNREGYVPGAIRLVFLGLSFHCGNNSVK